MTMLAQVTGLLAQMGHWGVEKILIAILVIGGAVAILLIAMKAMGMTLPDWIWKILVICAVVFVAAVAIHFVFNL
jgi:hypothetical protein